MHAADRAAQPICAGGVLHRHRPLHTSFVQHLPRAVRWYRNYLPLFPAAVEAFDPVRIRAHAEQFSRDRFMTAMAAEIDALVEAPAGEVARW